MVPATTGGERVSRWLAAFRIVSSCPKEKEPTSPSQSGTVDRGHAAAHGMERRISHKACGCTTACECGVPVAPNAQIGSAVLGRSVSLTRDASTQSFGFVLLASPAGSGGMRVLDVTPGSDAQELGVKLNDVLTEVNGERVIELSYADVMAKIDASRDHLQARFASHSFVDRFLQVEAAAIVVQRWYRHLSSTRRRSHQQTTTTTTTSTAATLSGDGQLYIFQTSPYDPSVDRSLQDSGDFGTPHATRSPRKSKTVQHSTLIPSSPRQKHHVSPSKAKARARAMSADRLLGEKNVPQNVGGERLSSLSARVSDERGDSGCVDTPPPNSSALSPCTSSSSSVSPFIDVAGVYPAAFKVGGAAFKLSGSKSNVPLMGVYRELAEEYEGYPAFATVKTQSNGGPRAFLYRQNKTWKLSPVLGQDRSVISAFSPANNPVLVRAGVWSEAIPVRGSKAQQKNPKLKLTPLPCGRRRLGFDD